MIEGKVSNRRLTEEVNKDTNLATFLDIISKRYLDENWDISQGMFYNLRQVSNYVDTIEDLKKLAESVYGFHRLKNGVTYNENRVLPKEAIQGFGRKRLEELNKILTEYQLEQVPWMTKKISRGEFTREKGLEWSKNIKI